VRNPLDKVVVVAALSFMSDVYRVVERRAVTGEDVLRTIETVALIWAYLRKSRHAGDVALVSVAAFAPIHLLLMRLRLAPPMSESSKYIWLALWVVGLVFVWRERASYIRWSDQQNLRRQHLSSASTPG
jgi:hypothetical protein